MRRFMGMQRYSRWVAWSVVAAYVAQVFAGILVGHYLITIPSSWVTISGAVATAIFIGTRLRGINNIVHECTHSSFSDHREDNVTIGRLCSSILTGCFKTYKEDHLSHHAHLGDYEHDAELGPIQKLGLHEPLTFRTILRHLVTPLMGRHLSTYSSMNLSGADGWFFGTFKFLMMAAIALVGAFYPFTVIFFVLIPLFYIFPTLNFWTDCLDHAGLVGTEDELRASRNVLAPAPLRLMFFPRNDCYHLVHHLFPQIPARHLHIAHDELCSDADYRGEPLASEPTHRVVSRPMASA